MSSSNSQHSQAVACKVKKEMKGDSKEFGDRVEVSELPSSERTVSICFSVTFNTALDVAGTFKSFSSQITTACYTLQSV